VKILFLRGWHSLPGGVKPTFLESQGATVVNPELRDEDWAEAVQLAQEAYDRDPPDVIVASSRGGAVAMALNSRGTPMVLLCPAWKRWGTATCVPSATKILHSKGDDVVNFRDSEDLARNSGLPASALIEVGTDHRLADLEPLRAMWEACVDLTQKRQESFSLREKVARSAG